MRWSFLSKYRELLAAVGIGALSALVSQTAAATTVTISRMSDGVLCSGWAVTPNIVATAAHCVLTPGHYSVSTAEKTYQVFRIRVHPEFNPAYLYNAALRKEQVEFDLALLQIIQRDFSVETYDDLKSKDALQGVGLFAVRGKRPDRPNEIEELPYTKLEIKTNGIVISNGGKAYGICSGDAGTPLFARVGDARVIVGIIAGTSPYTKLRVARHCEEELEVIDSSVILQFLDSIRQSKR